VAVGLDAAPSRVNTPAKTIKHSWQPSAASSQYPESMFLGFSANCLLMTANFINRQLYSYQPLNFLFSSL
jgi:hypothetical protein